MSISKKQRDADPHAGPGDSFPLDREHLKAAWDLAGHAADPEKVRKNVLAFAHAHGMTDRLPKDAVEHAVGVAKKAFLALQFVVAAKAKGEDLASAYKMAWDSANHTKAYSGQTWMEMHHKILAHAHESGNMDKLPEEAHTMMHDVGFRHEHDGVTQSDDGEAGSYSGAGHVHMVSKAFDFPTSYISKAWLGDDGKTYIEGWISTPDRDMQKDVVEPEAFLGSMDAYARLGMPLSSEHNTDALPIGHMQQVAVVRDGQVLKKANHPSDAADFEFFPGTGSGVWGRGVVNESKTAFAVKSGNVRGFSWIGLPVGKSALPGGGHRITEVTPWAETTVAAYPINQSAAIMTAKAFGK